MMLHDAAVVARDGATASLPAHALPFVVASVVNWNTPAATIACIEALLASTYHRMRVVVVDNGSRDGSVATIRKGHPDVTVQRAGDNLGFAAGHRLGLEQARAWGADAVWLVNSDAVVEPAALGALVDAWMRLGDAIYGGVPLRRRDDGEVLFDFPAKCLDSRAVPRVFARDDDVVFDAAWRAREVTAVGAVAGSAMLVPLAVVARHGWLDDSWFLHCEEIDYCYRLRARGVATWLVPAARVWHAGGGSHAGRRGVADVVQYYRARNEIALAARHGLPLAASMIAVKKMWRAVSLWARERERAKFVLRGAWDGWRRVSGRTWLPDDRL